MLLHHLMARLRQTKEILCFPASRPSLSILYFWFCAVSHLNMLETRPSYSLLPQLLLQKLFSWIHHLPVTDTSVWIQTSGLSPTEFAFFVFFFFTGLRVGERGSGKNIFLFLLKKFPNPPALRNSLGLPFTGGVESKESEISAIKDAYSKHTERMVCLHLHCLEGIWAHRWCQVPLRKEDPHGCCI